MKRQSGLLFVDGLINLALGFLLAVFPRHLAEFLGIPIPNTPFYASLLGAILTGIGAALLLEYYTQSAVITGLGVEGAIIINMLSAGTLIVWLVAGHLELPQRGYLFLWSITILVLLVTVLELIHILRQR
jgi:hypothetical protein